MNKWQKGVLGNRVEEDEKVLKKIKKAYQEAEKEIDDKIASLLARKDTENLQSIIYQVEYQKALKTQINGILDSLNSKQFDDISKYLAESYENGFVGVMYDLHGQGIPLVMPIDQEQVARVLKNNSKLSKNLWGSLYDRNSALQGKLRAEMSRGIAQNLSYSQIAKNVANQMGIGYNNIARIVRTESHRITQEASIDAQYKAKEAGADIVKQWDATLDGRTRPEHKMLDGQIRELDEPFEVLGNTAQYPGGFGVPGLDIYCRCSVLQRAKWGLDEEELETLKERAETFGLDKNDSFEDFKKKYIDAIHTDPNEGKVFHMMPDGTLVEGKMPGMDVIKQNGLTGEIEVLEKGEDYAQYTWSINEDGTYSKGIVKDAAQYKIDIPNNKVLTIDASHLSAEQLDYFDDMPEDAINQIIFDELPEELSQKIEAEIYGGATPSFDDALKKVLAGEGYQGIQVINTDADTQDKIEDFFQLFDDSVVTKTKKSKFETVSTSLANAKKKLGKIDNKTYSGIWYNQDVSVSDYAAYKGKIQAKKDWYLQQIANGSPNAAQYQKYLDDLDEFEKLGQEYEKAAAKVKKLEAEVVKYAPKQAGSFGDAYTQERKDAAYWFTNKNGSTKGADGVLRDKAGEVWRGAPTTEKEAIYGYTISYSKINEPLRGYEYGTNKYLGVGNVDLDQIGVKYRGFKVGEVRKQIDDMTSIIEKSSYDFDIWVNRGTGLTGMDKFFGIQPSDFNLPEKDLAAKLLGTTPTEYGFMSTGVAKGKGFSGAIKLNIYAPKGTKMMYVEPFSHYRAEMHDYSGKAFGLKWNGIDKQSSFGSEAEMILQRGTQFRVTKVEKSGGTWYIDMEVIGQSH